MGGYSDDNTIYAVISRPVSNLQVIEYLNRDSAAIHFGCLKWHMSLNPRKI